MYEIRIHGLGGEGVVRLSEMIGKTAMKCDKWAHSFPFFGTEIRGAAVKAFTRVSDSPISIKSYIYEPDVVIVTNDVLLNSPDTLDGLGKEGFLIINTTKTLEELSSLTEARIYPIISTALAYDIIGMPIVNTILFGALMGVTEILPVDAALAVIAEQFNEKVGKLNAAAFRQGYDYARKVI